MSNLTLSVLNQCLRLARATVPAHCVLCGASSPHVRLCAPCAAGLPRLPGRLCAICAVPLTSGDICGACIEHPPRYDSVTAAFPYTFPIDALVQAYKYRGHLALAPLLAALLARELVADVDAIVPMPLAPARLSARGFNQAHELARHLGHVLRLPVLGAACRKVADTPPQAALPFSARARNVRGAFVCSVNLKGRRVAVVDDVMTTGATLNELARNLKRAGAIHVSGWVVARTLRE